MREEEEEAEVIAWHGRVAVAAIAAAVALLVPGAAGAATITVTSATDDQLADPDDLDCALREAIQAANANAAVDQCAAGQASPNVDTVAIGDVGAFGPDTFTISGSLDVSAPAGPVVIDGRGQTNTIIDANDTGAVINIQNAGAVTIQDLSVVDGRSTNADGGGIRSTFASLTLDNVRVDQNQVTGSNALGLSGAGVFTGNNSASTLTIRDSVFANNQVVATGSVAGTTNRGGAIHIGTSFTASIDRSTISNNGISGLASQTLRGGSISTLDAQGDLTITNSTINGNFLANGGTQGGGGVDWDESGTDDTLRVQNVTFSGNSVGASGHGGAVYTNGDAIISHTTIGPNTGLIGAGLFVSTTGVEIRNSLVETGTTADCGGAERAVSQGYNIERGPSDDCQFSDPTDQLPDQSLMAALAANGGPTQTHEIAFDFIDLIPTASCLGTDGAPLTQDQRGAPRQFDDGIVDTGPNCDPGAYEEASCLEEPAKVIGTPGDDTLTGTVGTEIILALGGADVIRPGAGSDRICAGDGDDTLGGGDDDASPDFYGGGSGSDTYDLTDFNAGATVNLATAEVQPSASLGNEVINSLENVIGGDGGDTITGDAGPNRLDGASGNDMITGAGGSDQLLGNFGNLDALFARDGVSDLVDCGVGTGDTAQTDRLSLDSVTGCEGVDALPEPPVVTPVTPTAPTAGENPECATLRAKLKKAKSKKKKKKIRKQLRALGC